MEAGAIYVKIGAKLEPLDKAMSGKHRSSL